MSPNSNAVLHSFDCKSQALSFASTCNVFFNFIKSSLYQVTACKILNQNSELVSQKLLSEIGILDICAFAIKYEDEKRVVGGCAFRIPVTPVST